MQVQTRGEFGGLGIEVTMEDGVVKVVTPIDDTPAARAGVLANDVITQIDGEQVQGLTLNQAVDKMRGPVNSPVTLTIQRKEQDGSVRGQADPRRRSGSSRSGPAARAATSAIIRITQFNEQTYRGPDAARSTSSRTRSARTS